MIDYKKLIESGVHFGHQKTRWCPKMKPYIWGHKKGVHLIDISKTAQNLEKAAEYLRSVAAEGKSILLVGTKPAAQAIIERIGTELKVPYINYRWVGGLLTNHSQVRKSVTKFLHYEDILVKSEDSHYTKKELSILKKDVERLKKTVGGIVNLVWPVGAIVVVDVKREATVIKEALQCDVPVVGLVDTNSDPSGISYVVPANDDSPKSIKLILDYLAGFIEAGLNDFKEAKAAKKNEEATKKEAKKALEAEEAIVELEEDEEENSKPKAKPKVIKKASPVRKAKE